MEFPPQPPIEGETTAPPDVINEEVNTDAGHVEDSEPNNGDDSPERPPAELTPPPPTQGETAESKQSEENESEENNSSFESNSGADTINSSSRSDSGTDTIMEKDMTEEQKKRKATQDIFDEVHDSDDLDDEVPLEDLKNRKKARHTVGGKKLQTASSKPYKKRV